MVRLEDFLHLIASLLLTRFQFQYGTIRSIVLYAICASIVKFQFQYGTIRSSNPSPDSACVSSFQFQYGTIRRTVRRVLCFQYSYFNSSMVRLEALLCQLCILLLRFQFQYGTIRSSIQEPKISGHFNFNSSMVRLEDSVLIAKYCLITYFNSSMVRLEVKNA